MNVDLRPMTLEDATAVAAVVERADEHAEREAGRVPQTQTEEDRRGDLVRGTRRFIERDPDGAWVAVDGDTVVGMAQAIRRGSFWGLSMLFIDPAWQSRGLGRRLLDAALVYAQGAELRMIVTSQDPRALRRYALAGLAIHPTVAAKGVIDREAIPDQLDGRLGDAGDLDLVADVDSRLRGSRAEDVAYLLESGATLQVLDEGAARGYVVHRRKRLLMLGATDEATASVLLWRFLDAAGGEADISRLTARQDWAVRVALAARRSVSANGPLFIGGRADPPGPWLPSGWYF